MNLLDRTSPLSKTLFLFVLFFVFFSLTNHAEANIALLEDYGGTTNNLLTSIDGDASAAFAAYLDFIIQTFMGLLSIAAVAMIIFGGISYIGSETYAKKSDAKDMIVRSLGAIVLVLSSFIFFEQLNPALLEVNIQPLNVTRNVDGAGGFYFDEDAQYLENTQLEEISDYLQDIQCPQYSASQNISIVSAEHLERMRLFVEIRETKQSNQEWYGEDENTNVSHVAISNFLTGDWFGGGFDFTELKIKDSCDEHWETATTVGEDVTQRESSLINSAGWFDMGLTGLWRDCVKKDKLSQVINGIDDELSNYKTNYEIKCKLRAEETPGTDYYYVEADNSSPTSP